MSFCLVLVGNMNKCGASWKLEGCRLPPGDRLLLCPVSKGPRTPAALSKQDETARSWVSVPGALLSLLNHVSRYGPNVPPRGTPGTPAQESGRPHSRPHPLRTGKHPDLPLLGLHPISSLWPFLHFLRFLQTLMFSASSWNPQSITTRHRTLSRTSALKWL